MKRLYQSKTFETLFADDFSGSSGNLEVDNNAVTMLSTATANEAMVEEEEAPIEEVEKTAVMDDLQLESPVATPLKLQQHRLPDK